MLVDVFCYLQTESGWQFPPILLFMLSLNILSGFCIISLYLGTSAEMFYPIYRVDYVSANPPSYDYHYDMQLRYSLLVFLTTMIKNVALKGKAMKEK